MTTADALFARANAIKQETGAYPVAKAYTANDLHSLWGWGSLLATAAPKVLEDVARQLDDQDAERRRAKKAAASPLPAPIDPDAPDGFEMVNAERLGEALPNLEDVNRQFDTLEHELEALNAEILNEQAEQTAYARTTDGRLDRIATLLETIAASLEKR